MALRNELKPVMPGTVRTVQILMWIGVVLGAISFVIGILGMAVIASGNLPAGTSQADLPAPDALSWASLLISAVLLVVMLVLAIRIPRRAAGTRNAIVWLFGVSAVLALATILIGSSLPTIILTVAISVLVIALLMTQSAKDYFNA